MSSNWYLSSSDPIKPVGIVSEDTKVKIGGGRTGSSGDTGDEEVRMVERQSDGESWQPNGESNERTSGGKETQWETEKKMK